MKTLLNSKQVDLTLLRLAHQLVEDHIALKHTVIIGIQPRGVFLSDRIVEILERITKNKKIEYGKLDITFYRDDVHSTEIHVPSVTDIPFSVQGKRVILIDDVLHTGRTIRAAMDALVDFGRPERVELLVLVDRRFSREVPIHPDYTGYSVDTILTQRVKVRWKENDEKDEVVLLDKV